VRRLVLGMMAVVVVGFPLLVLADEYSACWVEERPDGVGRYIQVTVCRNSGTGELEEFSSDDAIPEHLSPNYGADGAFFCWYWTTAFTGWFAFIHADGSANLGTDINGPLPGGVVILPPLPRCTSEPVEAVPPDVQAWALIAEYIHDRPQPVLNPIAGRGLAGLETHVAVVPPVPFDDSLNGPGTFLEVHAEVAAVIVAWGDGTTDEYPAEVFSRLTGYPHGMARHLYETKTCDEPGLSPDCHPDLAAYPLSVGYQWFAQWRVNGGPWQVLDVEPTSTVLDYPVTEIVSVLTQTG